MARYTNDNVRNNADFLNFIKNEYGYDSTEAIPAFEYNAILYKFKAKENDFDDEDFAALEAYADNEKLQDIVDIYYPEKTVKDLSMEDTAFVQAIARETANNPDVSLDIIRESRRQKKMRAAAEASKHYSKEDLDGIMKAHEVYLQAPDEVQNHETLKADREKAPAQRTVSGDGKEATLAGIVAGLQRNAQEREKPQDRGAAGIVINETTEKELQKDERESGIDKLQQNEGENARIRSDHNLSNEQKLAAVRLLVMSNMEVISAEDYKKYSTDIRGEDIQKAQEAFEFVDNAEEKVKKPEEYKNQMVDVLLNRDLSVLMTPEMTTVAYDNLQKRIAEAEKQAKKEKSDEADQNVAALNTKLEDVLSRMDSLQSDFKNKRGFYLLDVTNAADAYDGYMHMFDVRQKDLDAKNKALEQDKKELDAEADKERIAEIDKEMAAKYKRAKGKMPSVVFGVMKLSTA